MNMIEVETSEGSFYVCVGTSYINDQVINQCGQKSMTILVSLLETNSFLGQLLTSPIIWILLRDVDVATNFVSLSKNRVGLVARISCSFPYPLFNDLYNPNTDIPRKLEPW